MGCHAEDYPQWVKFLEDRDFPVYTQCPVYPDLEELFIGRYYFERFYNSEGNFTHTLVHKCKVKITYIPPCENHEPNS